MRLVTLTLSLMLSLLVIEQVFSGGAVLEVICKASGHRDRFVQGSTREEEADNIQQIVVVCERANEIRNVKTPIDPNKPTGNEPLLARQFGEGRSDLLGISLPRFLVPGNTCPLFPITAYLDHNICPIDGSAGFAVTVVGYYD